LSWSVHICERVTLSVQADAPEQLSGHRWRYGQFVSLPAVPKLLTEKASRKAYPSVDAARVCFTTNHLSNHWTIVPRDRACAAFSAFLE
jgi:hypothetical protein